MLDNLNKLRKGNLKEVNNNMLYPLLRWCSGSLKDLSWCNKVNKNFFWVDREIMKGLLFLGLEDKSQFLKYPKSTKEKNKEFLIRKEVIKQYFKWSEQEFNRNINVINFVNLNKICKDLGTDNKINKILNIKQENENKGLFSYV